MTQNPTAQECPAEDLLAAVDILKQDDEAGLARIDELIQRYDGDARLHFLKGSLLAGMRRYEEAHVFMQRAVERAPGYAIARFQLGFLEMTSGDYPAARTTWAPLLDLPAEDPLLLFVMGLEQLAKDSVPEGIELLRQGIARNTDNPPLNNDMQLIIDKTLEEAGARPADDEPTTATHLLLQRYANKTKH